MASNLADKIQVWGFDENIVIFKDGSLGFGFELSTLDVSTWNFDKINHLANQCDQFLNGLPPQIDLQLVQEIKPGNQLFLSEHQTLGSQCKNPMVFNMMNERVDRLNKKDKEGEIPIHGLKCFVRRPLSRKLISKSSLFSKTELFPEIAETEFINELAETRRVMENIGHGLELLGLKVDVLDQSKLLDEIYQQWNPNRSKKKNIGRGHYDPDCIIPSLVFSDAFVTDKGFCIGETYCKLVSLKSLPETTMSSMAQVLRELPFDSKLFLSIHVPDQQIEYENLQSQRRMAFSMARGKRVGVSDLESEAKLQDIESLLAALISQGEKIFDMSFQVLLSSENEDELDQQVALTLTKVRELAGAEAMQETIASFDIFSELAIPNAQTIERRKKIKTCNLSDLLPIYGPWGGHEKASILLRSRLGSLVKFDPFSKELTNHNMLVSGGSGSGKSFCANILLLHLLKENPKVYIVDIGNSYGRLCELLGGQYVRFGIDMDLSLNPFDLPMGESVPTGEKVKFLVSLIEIMTKENGASGLTKLERSEIEESIFKCYEEHKQPTLSDLKTILLSHDDVNLRRLGRILNSWTGDTPYGKFIDRPTSIELKKGLISFDLKGLDSAPDLQAICLFIITDLVWREVQQDKATKKLLIFDECWQLLENESGAHFIGNVFRTFRKYYAGVIAISQDIDDFARSKVAGAILPNSSTKWLLMQKGANQERLREVLQLNDTELALIASLYQERGRFSESYLIAGDHRSVVAIEPTPLEYWIATTDPRDIAYFDNFKIENSHLNPIEVLKQIAKEKPYGVVN